MKDMSVIVIQDAKQERLLLRRRRKDPYRGLIDFIGGACESGEEPMRCAYRTLLRHTGMSEAEVCLVHVMDFAYPVTQQYVQVFAGQMAEGYVPDGAYDALVWVETRENFEDAARFAGEGYIGHILSHMQMQTE